MKKILGGFILILICSFLWIGAAHTGSDSELYWPQWRGPLFTGESPNGNPPIKWSENHNIKWKTPIPGRGFSTPVVWENQIFITTAIPTDKPATEAQKKAAAAKLPEWQRRRGASTPSHVQQFVLLAIQRDSGTIMWKKVLDEALPHEGTHKDGSWASGSPVTDGEHVIAFFGSFGLYCLDMSGNLIWKKDLGDMTIRASFGEGASPFLWKEYLIVNWDHEGDSFIAVFNKRTGKEVWRKTRKEVTSWSSPIVVEHNGREQVIVNATDRSRGYDLLTGDVIWQVRGMTVNVIPTPVHRDGKVYLMSGFRGSAIQAIDLDKAKGEITGTEAVVWEKGKDTPYTPSPLLFENTLYFLRSNSERLTCMDGPTGAIHFGPVKLEGLKGVYASPVSAQDRVYIVGRNGVTKVLKKGTELKELATNTLDDKIDASPVIVDNTLILRGHKNLYCIKKN